VSLTQVELAVGSNMAWLGLTSAGATSCPARSQKSPDPVSMVTLSSWKGVPTATWVVQKWTGCCCGVAGPMPNARFLHAREGIVRRTASSLNDPFFASCSMAVGAAKAVVKRLRIKECEKYILKDWRWE